MSLPEGTGCEICGRPLAQWRLAEGQTLDRCPSCGHVERDLDRCPARSRDRAWGGEGEMDKVRLALTYRRLRRIAGTPRSVFEAGFGTGALLRRFADDGARVAGADPGYLGVGVDPEVAAAGALVSGPVEAVSDPGGYDLVYAVHVIEHVPDPWSFVAACWELLAPGGLLVLLTPAGDSAGLRRFGAHWWMLEDPTHVRFFSARSLTELLTGSGLVDVAVDRPVSDSLGVEAASTVRLLRRTRAPAGVLPALTTRVAVVASLPVVVPVRSLRAPTRPTLQARARRPVVPA